MHIHVKRSVKDNAQIIFNITFRSNLNRHISRESFNTEQDGQRPTTSDGKGTREERGWHSSQIQRVRRKIIMDES